MSSRPPRPSAIAEALYGADRALMLHHFPRAVRPAIAALWAVDEAMASVVAEATQPALGAIKLAWWAEALARLDTAPPPPEPRLQAVLTELIPLGITGTDVAGIEPGWRALLDETPEVAEVAIRGQVLFVLTARLIEAEDPLLDDAGALFAVGDALHRGFALPDERGRIIERLAGRRIGRAARPVTLAARLAARDPGEAEATPGRALALMAHRLTGALS